MKSINILARVFNRLINIYKTQAGWLKWKAFLVKHSFPLGLKKGDWSLNIDDFEAVFQKIRIVKHNKPMIFVELGSGVSTVIFGIFLSRINPKTSIISFEGKREWAVKVEALIKRYGLSKQANVYHIPYKQYSQYLWFDDKKIADIINGRKIDALVVDAPPADLCFCSRKPAIPFFLQWMVKETIVFLHDTTGKNEAETAKAWSKYFKVCECINTGAGIAFCKELDRAN